MIEVASEVGCLLLLCYVKLCYVRCVMILFLFYLRPTRISMFFVSDSMMFCSITNSFDTDPTGVVTSSTMEEVLFSIGRALVLETGVFCISNDFSNNELAKLWLLFDMAGDNMLVHDPSHALFPKSMQRHIIFVDSSFSSGPELSTTSAFIPESESFGSDTQAHDDAEERAIKSWF